MERKIHQESFKTPFIVIFFSQKYQAKHASMYISIDLKANKRYYRWLKNTLKSFNKIFLYGYYKYIHKHMHVKRQQKLGTML